MLLEYTRPYRVRERETEDERGTVSDVSEVEGYNETVPRAWGWHSGVDSEMRVALVSWGRWW